MSGGQGKWTTVQRRRRSTTANNIQDATSYYVAGMSNGAMKSDIRRCFEGFGELVDVFMGKKKDTSGKNFAFVKFINVGDIWELERNMQNVSCAGKALSVNLARYGRNKNPIDAVKTQIGDRARIPQTTIPGHPSPIYRPIRSSVGGNRRSYADVTTGMQKQQEQPTLAPPISLSAANANGNWLKNNVLVGEALSIDHMASLHSGLHGDDTVENVTYLGGLNVALCFKDQSTEEKFRNENGKVD
ncbi:hypothetical protein LXL04_000440 [Taraxacum kok-saghyz]